MVAAAFQNVSKANDVTVNIGQRVVDGVTESGLGSEVDHTLGLIRCKGCFYGTKVSQVDAQVLIAGVIDMPAQTRFFDGGVVIIVVVVNTNNCVAALKQAQGEGRTDEACGSSDELLDTHRFKLKGATDMRLQLLYLPPKKRT